MALCHPDRDRRDKLGDDAMRLPLAMSRSSWLADVCFPSAIGA
jgi:hypothetical protein